MLIVVPRVPLRFAAGIVAKDIGQNVAREIVIRQRFMPPTSVRLKQIHVHDGMVGMVLALRLKGAVNIVKPVRGAVHLS